MAAEPMTISERGRAFRQWLRGLATRTPWDGRRCPRCGQTDTWRHGTSARHPWTVAGRPPVAVQRQWCVPCRRTDSEQSALLVRGSWYARAVPRQAIDHWQHVGSRVRRTAEWLRSGRGRQERWRLWRPLDPEPAAAARCWLRARPVPRPLGRAGVPAEPTIPDQVAGVASAGQRATAGLWARRRGPTTRVVLLLVDCVTGGRRAATRIRRWWWRVKRRPHRGPGCSRGRGTRGWTGRRCGAWCVLGRPGWGPAWRRRGGG